jgi:hypothetical protein
MRGDRVGQVAGGSARHRVEAELLGFPDGDGDHAILEGPGRVAHRVVLDVELLDAELLGEVSRAHQRREADRLADVRVSLGQVQRQQVGVAPDAWGTRLDALAAHEGADDLVVVVDLERTEAELADVDWC